MEEENLKTGDTVLVWGGQNHPYLSKIINITPKGFIKITGGSLFSKEGRQRGGSDYYCNYIRIPDKADMNQIISRRLKKKVRGKLQCFENDLIVANSSIMATDMYIKYLEKIDLELNKILNKNDFDKIFNDEKGDK